MKPGIKDVAKVAGVSPTTVSRVLNNRGYISEETRKKVYDAMEEINYYPSDFCCYTEASYNFSVINNILSVLQLLHEMVMLQ